MFLVFWAPFTLFARYLGFTSMLKELLSEKGDISTTRVVQILGLFMAFAIAIIGLNKGSDSYGLSLLCLSFIIPQTIAKVLQKRLETK